jgi:hypothetical protein
MSLRKLFTLVLPSVLAGGLLLSPTPDGHADDGRTLLAQGPTLPPDPPQPPQPPRPPRAPHPPRHGGHGGHGGPGIHITIDGNKIDLSGIDGMVRGQLEAAKQMIRSNPRIPPPLRAKLLARLDKVRASVDKRLAKLKGKNLDQLGEELEKLGEDIEDAMEGLDEELEQLGEQLGKDFAKKFKHPKFKFDFHTPDDDDDDDDEDDEDDDISSIPMTPDLDASDSDDMRDALNDLRGMAIKPDQKAKIAQIRAESDGKVAAARRQLDQLSKKLEVALGNPNTSDADIRRYVDAISQQEAEIRKARILAWVNARRVLDENQRKRIEAAAKKKSR